MTKNVPLEMRGGLQLIYFIIDVEMKDSFLKCISAGICIKVLSVEPDNVRI
jgi:hypothetical protein